MKYVFRPCAEPVADVAQPSQASAMHKGQAQAEQFYTRTGSEATKGSRKGFGLLGGGECPVAVMTDVQREDAERHAHNLRNTHINAELAAIRLALGQMRVKTGAEFRQLVARRDGLLAEYQERLACVQAINARIRATRPKPPPDGVPRAFMETAQEVLTASQFQMILKAAFERANRQAGPEASKEPQPMSRPVPRVRGKHESKP